MPINKSSGWNRKFFWQDCSDNNSWLGSLLINHPTFFNVFYVIRLNITAEIPLIFNYFELSLFINIFLNRIISFIKPRQGDFELAYRQYGPLITASAFPRKALNKNTGPYSKYKVFTVREYVTISTGLRYYTHIHLF